MKVLLRNNWFGPDANLYIRDPNGTEIPPEYEKLLPSTATVVEDDYVAPQKKAEKPGPNTLSGISKSKYGSEK